MIIIVCSLLAIVSVPLIGGRVHRLADLSVARPWLAWASILLHTALVSGPWDISHRFGQMAHVASYALAGGFVLANRRLPGIAVICIGGALNPAAIVANGGVMPASAAAMRAAGLTAESGFTNTGQIDHAKLAWLGDVFAIPSGWPLANVFSIGDIAAVIGVGYLAH
jgi:hypothetical protein